MQNPHDRSALHRADEAWLKERWGDDATRVLVVAGNRIRPGADGVDWKPPSAVPEGERFLLGVRDDVAYFAVVVDPSVADAEPDAWVSLRAILLPLVTESVPGDASLVLHALGLAEWRLATRYCARCGMPLEVRKEGHELVCEHGHVTFPRTDPAVIMLITDGEPGSDDERCLLGHNPAWPAGRFSTLAGFCEPGESLEDAVRREVVEESGVRVGDVTYFGNQPWPLPASLMLGFTGRAVSTDIECDPDELAEARWFTRAELETATTSGEVVLPGGVSISRSLIEDWYGKPLPGSW